MQHESKRLDNSYLSCIVFIVPSRPPPFFGYICCSIYRIPLGDLSINIIDFLVLVENEINMAQQIWCPLIEDLFIVLEIFDAGFEDEILLFCKFSLHNTRTSRAAHVGVCDPSLSFLIGISLREIEKPVFGISKNLRFSRNQRFALMICIIYS